MQIKTQKQMATLQNKAQKVANNLDEVVIAKGVQHIQVQAGTVYQLNAKDFDTKKINLIAKKVGDDLEVALEEDVIIFDNYFAVCATDLSCLVSLPTEDGGLYHIVADVFFTLEDGTQIVYFYGEQSIVATESNGASVSDNQSFFDVVTSNIGIVAAVVVVAVVASSGSDNGDNGDNDNNNLNPPVIQGEVGRKIHSTDQITIKAEANSMVTITFSANGKKIEKTIEFTSNDTEKNAPVLTPDELKQLGDGKVNVSVVSVKDGVTSSVISSSFTLDTTSPTFDQQQPTTVDILSNTSITTTIYDAQATDGGNADADITYSIKGVNADKFSITTDTGILTYKEKQTSKHDDTVIIIATDLAGNKVEKSITVSIKNLVQGFVINGETPKSLSGTTVSSAGDVNGDGLDDLIILSLYDKDDRNNSDEASRTYVVFGKINETVVDLSTIRSSSDGFIINGEMSETISGISASSAGDVNGDGLDDLIIGSHWVDLAGNTQVGKSFVVFGKINTNAINLSDITSGTGGFVINGENTNDGSGISVSSAGDVNGDGSDDLIIGAYGANGFAGKSFVVFGKNDTNAINLSTIESGTGGFAINNDITADSDAGAGASVSSAGDVNGDGLDDLIVGAYRAQNSSGKSFVVFGKKDNRDVVNLSAIESGTGGFVINGENSNDFSGYSVSSAGDVNGDGLDDLIVGAHQADLTDSADAGKSYVVFGKANTDAINLSNIVTGTGGFVINGENAGDKSGYSVSSAGDVNGDGLDDLIVGAYYADSAGKADIGKSFVVFGKADTTTVNLSNIISGTGGFVINGENAGDKSGYSVSSAGDVNGDGLDDLIIGAPSAGSANNANAGKSFVVFGKTDTKSVDLTNVSAGEGIIAHTIDFQGDTGTSKNDTLTGTSNDELFVAGLGDDILTGNGGTDVFNAGAGDDTIIINNDNLAKLYSNTLASHLLARVDGGGNTDTLKLAGASLNLDLTQIDNGRIQDIEIIDLTGSGDNTLKLNLNDLLDISSETNTLRVIGDSGDKVEATGFNKSTAGDVANGITLGNVTYDVYINTSASTAELWIDQDLEVI
ncbi:hypothetical protein [uncultured Gammaproteobacteria bacterium]|nr:hypothetical protein [uncultured Gammaproteobacteria bacterium]